MVKKNKASCPIDGATVIYLSADDMYMCQLMGAVGRRVDFWGGCVIVFK
jgi:hypothetical protein